MIEPRDETRSRLAKLAPGPWVSAGGYVDYEQWADRERFIWLDAQIAVQRHLEQEREERRQRSGTNSMNYDSTNGMLIITDLAYAKYCQTQSNL